jgi:hypothetical protein
MRMFAMSLAVAAVAVTAAPAAAQHEGHGAGGAFPAGWQGRVDRANQNIADVKFMTMGEAFHITTGPHVILWNPQHTAENTYRASVTYTQMKAPERLEGFGLIVGGQNLDAPNQDYLYFLIRHDGRYMVRHRAGDEVHTLAEWTESPAIRRATETERAENTVAIESLPGRVVFRVNGTEVHSLDRVPMLNTNGIVGFRIGHHLDMHVSQLKVEPIGN